MSGSRRRARMICAGLALVASLSLSACKEAEEESAEGYSPSHIEAVKGSDDDLQHITFTEEGARRTDVKTAEVRRAGKHTVVPYAALIYNDEAKTFVYTSPKDLEYQRAPVTVDRIEGNRVLLTDSPPVGTKVVTRGAAEVYGTELDMAGSH